MVSATYVEELRLRGCYFVTLLDTEYFYIEYVVLATRFERETNAMIKIKTPVNEFELTILMFKIGHVSYIRSENKINMYPLRLLI